MKILKYKTAGSTQELAKKLKEPAPWTVILAKEQTGGYGRKKTAWFSPPGGLYFSVILPKSHIKDLQILTILAAFVVAEKIKNDLGLEPFIKLPNDVYLNGKKVCGVLTENVTGKTVRASVMGIGLNTNTAKIPRNLAKKVTSLKIESGKKIDDEKFLAEIVKGLKEKLKIINQ